MKYPILFMIGTIHGTDTEEKLFRILNKLKLDWLCEGENDFRKCKSLKDPIIHLVTDTLFVYMILNDVVKISSLPSIELDEYYDELIDRLIELLITISRQSDITISQRIISSIVKLDYNWILFLDMINHKNLNYQTLIEIEIKLRRLSIDQLIDYIGLLINRIIKIILNDKNINRHFDFRQINEFIKTKGDCQSCEDHIFMNTRDRSFYNIINNHNIKTITLVTVGVDHLNMLFKKFKKNTKYQIIRFKCIKHEDIKKLLNYLVYINNINEHTRS